ncbi:FMN reductase [Rhodococcus sp. NPDC127528]|uniref:FMN reductase n=1 Tax=unclassified Rhodococcus (in: high G+C Gram-positive bacteria) TaxID=192944 RepID=UPI003633627F
MNPRRIAVASAGLSVPSSTRMLADRLAAAAARSVGVAEGRPEVEVVELRDLAHDLMNNLLAGFPSEALRRAIETVVGADGLIVVTPVFNASYSGLFKSFFDVLEPGSLDGMPVLIAATGGTARHSLALEHAVRPMFAYLRSSVVPSAVFAASEDWAGGTEAGRGLTDRIDRAAAELATAMTGRPRRASIDPYESPVPFEQLMAQG